MGIMAVGMLLCLCIPKQLMGIFITNGKTLRLGMTALRLISLGFVVSSVSVTFSGVLEGLGKGIPSFFISLSRYVVVIIPAAWLLSRSLGADGVFLAFGIAELVTAGLAIGIFQYNKARTF